jgi:hypothetical protein
MPGRLKVNPQTLSDMMLIGQYEIRQSDCFGLVIESPPFSEEIFISAFKSDGSTVDYLGENAINENDIRLKYSEIYIEIPNVTVTINAKTMLITQNMETESEVALMVRSEDLEASSIGPDSKTVDLSAVKKIDQELLENGDRQAMLPPPLAFIGDGEDITALAHLGEINVDRLTDDTDLLAYASEQADHTRLFIDVYDDGNDTRVAMLSVEQTDYETGHRYRSLRQSQVLKTKRK